MKTKGSDYLIRDEARGIWRVDPEQAVRDDVEKHYWLNVGRTIVKDWRLYHAKRFLQWDGLQGGGSTLLPVRMKSFLTIKKAAASSPQPVFAG